MSEEGKARPAGRPIKVILARLNWEALLPPPPPPSSERAATAKGEPAAFASPSRPMPAKKCALISVRNLLRRYRIHTLQGGEGGREVFSLLASPFSPPPLFPPFLLSPHSLGSLVSRREKALPSQAHLSPCYWQIERGRRVSELFPPPPRPSSFSPSPATFGPTRKNEKAGGPAGEALAARGLPLPPGGGAY